MMSRRNYVVVGVVVLAGIIAIPLAAGLEWTWVQMNMDDTPIFGREFTITTAIAYGVAALAAVITLKNPKSYQMSLEVAEELSKVTWPSREETGNATVVVIVTVLICSAYLGLADAMWLWVTDMMMGAG